MKNEQADAGRDGWTRLARPNSQARTGTGEYSFSLFSWPRAGLATLPGWSILCYMWWPTCTEDLSNCCTKHVAKATDVFSGHDYIFHVATSRTSANWLTFFFLLLAASICCHRGRHRCDTVIHTSLQPIRGLCLKADLNFCVRPSVRGTPSSTTHSEGLLLREGTLPYAPTYNRGEVQHVVFTRFGLAQPHECSSNAATCHAKK